MNLDLSKTSGSDCIPLVVLKNCAPEFSYILVELFNKSLKGVTLKRGVPTQLVYLFVYSYIVVFGQVSETF